MQVLVYVLLPIIFMLLKALELEGAGPAVAQR